MYENLIYSLNATVPVFLVMVIGYLLRRINLLNEPFCTVANRFNFTVTLPALLFYDIATANIREGFLPSYVLYCAGVTTVSFFLIWGFARLFLKERSMVGAFVQASFRGSAAVLGIAFIQNIYGSAGMAPLMIVSCVPLFNIYSVLVLTFEGQTATRLQDSSSLETGSVQETISTQEAGTVQQAETAGRPKKDFSVLRLAVLNICKNPIILAILAGMLVSLSGITLPQIALKTVKNFANLATPLALIVIGATFEGTKALAKLKPALVATWIKLVLQPALFLPLGIALGFNNQLLIAALVMLAAPTTPSCYIMAKNMDNDATLTTSIVVLTTLLSSVTLTAWIYLLKMIGCL